MNIQSNAESTKIMELQPLSELAQIGFTLIRSLLHSRPQTQENIDCDQALAEALHNFPDGTANSVPWELTKTALSDFLIRYPEYAHYPVFRDVIK